MAWCSDPHSPPRIGMYGGNMSAPLIDVAVPAAAAPFFAQGLAQEWNYNRIEALRNFQHAVLLEPDCAVCWWGLARAHGPNRNRGIDDTAAFASALENATDALERAPAASSAKVRTLISTMALLVLPPSQQDDRTAVRASRTAYADTLCEAALGPPLPAVVGEPRVYDADLGSLCADARIAAASAADGSYYSTWLRSDGRGELLPEFAAVKRTLDLLVSPAAVPHALARHLAVHLYEPSSAPASYATLGQLAADSLDGLFPAAGHLQHMPAHIYLRVGRWADGVGASRRAVEADSAYLSSCLCPYAAGHNLRMGVWHARMLGSSAAALGFAREHRTTSQRFRSLPIVADAGHGSLPPCRDLGNDAVSAASPEEALTLALFGRWRELRSLPPPPPCADVDECSAQGLHRALRLLARGLADAALAEGAQEAEDALEATLSQLRPHVAAELDRVAPRLSSRPLRLHRPELLALGKFGAPRRAALLGCEIELEARRALAAGDASSAIGGLANLTALLEDLPYTEPPVWYYSPRVCWGALLLRQGRAADAADQFERSLDDFPFAGWALLGASQAHAALGHAARAAAYRQQFESSWADADVDLTSPCPQFDDAAHAPVPRAAAPADVAGGWRGPPPLNIAAGVVLLALAAGLLLRRRWRRRQRFAERVRLAAEAHLSGFRSTHAL